MPDRFKELLLENLPAAITAIVSAIGGLWAAVWSRRTTKAEAAKKEAEAIAATASARREADRLEQESWLLGFGGLKELVAYLQGMVTSLRAENDELRARIAALEKRVLELQDAHRTCEAETAKLRQELAGLRDRAA